MCVYLCVFITVCLCLLLQYKVFLLLQETAFYYKAVSCKVLELIFCSPSCRYPTDSRDTKNFFWLVSEIPYLPGDTCCYTKKFVRKMMDVDLFFPVIVERFRHYSPPKFVETPSDNGARQRVAEKQIGRGATADKRGAGL